MNELTSIIEEAQKDNLTIELAYRKGYYVANFYSKPKYLFGKILIKKPKLVRSCYITPSSSFSIDYVEDYKNFAFKCFNENPANNQILDLLNLTLALNSESGEYGDLVKKAIFFSKPINKSDLYDELGDIAFYFFNTLTFLGIDLKDILEGNKIKIQQRYPNGRNKDYLHNVRNKEEEKKRIAEFFKNLKKDDKLNISVNNLDL